MDMRMYKTEPHLHVKEVSPCAKLTADEMIKLYREAGFDTVFVSDHLKSVYQDKLGDIPTEEKTKIFLSGYEAAKKAGEKYGVTVLPSAELQLDNSKNHYLLYGFDESFLNREDLFSLSVAELHEYAKANGVLLIQAHPYRDGNNVPMPHDVDGFEAHNSNPRHENFSEKIFALAKEYGLIATAGSDSHRVEDVGGTGVLTEHKIESAEDYIRVLKEGNFSIL